MGTEVVETPSAVLETAALPLGYVPDGLWREGEDSNFRDPYIIRFRGGRLKPDSATFPYGADRGDRTPDLRFTKPPHRPCAMSAEVAEDGL